MPTPNTAPVLTDYISLGFNAGEPQSGWRRLTVSRKATPMWLYVPWDVEYHDPKGHHYNAGGWSILQGPCSYALRVHARCVGLEPGCSVHIQGVTVVSDGAGGQTIVAADEAPERFVGPLESSHTHVDGDLVGVLKTGERLQVRLDYWNAGAGLPQAEVYGHLVGATVRGFWGPIPADYVDTAARL